METKLPISNLSFKLLLTSGHHFSSLLLEPSSGFNQSDSDWVSKNSFPSISLQLRHPQGISFVLRSNSWMNLWLTFWLAEEVIGYKSMIQGKLSFKGAGPESDIALCISQVLTLWFHWHLRMVNTCVDLKIGMHCFVNWAGKCYCWICFMENFKCASGYSVRESVDVSVRFHFQPQRQKHLLRIYKHFCLVGWLFCFFARKENDKRGPGIHT